MTKRSSLIEWKKNANARGVELTASYLRRSKASASTVVVAEPKLNTLSDTVIKNSVWLGAVTSMPTITQSTMANSFFPEKEVADTATVSTTNT